MARIATMASTTMVFISLILPCSIGARDAVVPCLPVLAWVVGCAGAALDNPREAILRVRMPVDVRAQEPRRMVASVTAWTGTR